MKQINLAEWAIKHKQIVYFFIFFILLGGIMSYFSLGRSEDPAFTIREAVVTAAWPGASAEQITEQVTDPLEKTILCRKGDAGKYKSIADINRPEVKVMVNPGGTNEKFAKAYLPKATLIIHEQNAEIPGLIAEGKADIMITETMEAKKYAKMDSRLADPLVNQPFTKNRFGALMQKGDQEFLNYVNFFLAELETNGTMKNMEQKYIG